MMTLIFLTLSVSLLVLISIGLLIGLYYRALLKKEKKVKFIVVENNGGQLCNQLWHFARLAAFCKERNYALYNLPFYRYAPLFEQFNTDILLSPENFLKFPLPYLNTIRKRCYRYLRRLLKKKFLEHRFYCTDIENPLILDENFPNLKEENYFFFDWNFRSEENLKKHRAYLIELFRPKKEFKVKIDAFWKEISRDRLIVGVHIRHGDYRIWREGSHFFSVEETLKHMKMIAERYQMHRPLFIIYSNEQRTNEEFFPLEVKISTGSNIEDLYSMSRCDLIMGAEASTFNEWASWYGGVPRYTYENPQLDTLDFMILKQ